MPARALTLGQTLHALIGSLTETVQPITSGPKAVAKTSHLQPRLRPRYRRAAAPDRRPSFQPTHRRHGVTKPQVSQLSPTTASRARRTRRNPADAFLVFETHSPKQVLPGATRRHYAPPRLHPQGQGARRQLRPSALSLLLHRRALQGLQR